MNAAALRDALVRVLSSHEQIKGIGQTGRLNAPLLPGQSDLDLFVLCTQVPPAEVRQAWYADIADIPFTLDMAVCRGGHWGHGDILTADGVPVMPMYFTVSEMRAYLEDVLRGARMDKEGGFYPVGRLASVSSIHILHEDGGAWTALKTMVNGDHETFFRSWFIHEINQTLSQEDLGRAELRREVLFFHQVLENALDHWLQALFAVNGRFFPSRKRTLDDLETFTLKPEHCAQRLLRMIGDGASPGTVPDAVRALCALTRDLNALGARRFGLNKENEPGAQE